MPSPRCCNCWSKKAEPNRHNRSVSQPLRLHLIKTIQKALKLGSANMEEDTDPWNSRHSSSSRLSSQSAMNLVSRPPVVAGQVQQTRRPIETDMVSTSSDDRSIDRAERVVFARKSGPSSHGKTIARKTAHAEAQPPELPPRSKSTHKSTGGSNAMGPPATMAGFVRDIPRISDPSSWRSNPATVLARGTIGRREIMLVRPRPTIRDY
jgi:hypothetical protein